MELLFYQISKNDCVTKFDSIPILFFCRPYCMVLTANYLRGIVNIRSISF